MKNHLVAVMMMSCLLAACGGGGSSDGDHNPPIDNGPGVDNPGDDNQGVDDPGDDNQGGDTINETTGIVGQSTDIPDLWLVFDDKRDSKLKSMMGDRLQSALEVFNDFIENTTEGSGSNIEKYVNDPSQGIRNVTKSVDGHTTTFTKNRGQGLETRLVVTRTPSQTEWKVIYNGKIGNVYTFNHFTVFDMTVTTEGYTQWTRYRYERPSDQLPTEYDQDSVAGTASFLRLDSQANETNLLFRDPETNALMSKVTMTRHNDKRRLITEDTDAYWNDQDNRILTWIYGQPYQGTLYNGCIGETDTLKNSAPADICNTGS